MADQPAKVVLPVYLRALSWASAALMIAFLIFRVQLLFWIAAALGGLSIAVDFAYGWRHKRC